MPDELHAVDGLLDGHPFGIEQLRADDHGRILVIGRVLAHHRDLPRRDGAQHLDGRRLDIDALKRASSLVERRAPRMISRVDPLLLGTPHLFAQLVDSDLERRELVVVDRLRPHDRSLAGEGEFHRGVLAAPAVRGTVGDLDVEPLRAGREILDAGGLVVDDSTEAVRDSHAHADDAGVHL